MAVAIWDHRPEPHELLQARLDHGWTPTPSDVPEGNPIQGYASCLYLPPQVMSSGDARSQSHTRA